MKTYARWIQGYIVEVAGLVVRETNRKEYAEQVANNYRMRGYSPVHIMQGPVNKYSIHYLNG